MGGVWAFGFGVFPFGFLWDWKVVFIIWWRVMIRSSRYIIGRRLKIGGFIIGVRDDIIIKSDIGSVRDFSVVGG